MSIEPPDFPPNCPCYTHPVDGEVVAMLYDFEGRLVRRLKIPEPPAPFIMLPKNAKAVWVEADEEQPWHAPWKMLEFRFVERVAHLCWYEQVTNRWFKK